VTALTSSLYHSGGECSQEVILLEALQVYDDGLLVVLRTDLPNLHEI